MAFLDNSGLSKLWAKIKEQLNSKANASHDHISISGTASNITGVVDFAHGGTGRTSRDSGYSALMSGGVYKGNLNDAQKAGVYMFTTADTTNYPTYDGRTDSWARLEVTTSAVDFAEVMQRVIYSSEGVEFTRLHANGTTWTPWQIVVSGAVAHRQFDQSIPSGADLNDYRQNGVYVSHSSSNKIKNLPIYFGSEGAFTLVVTGISNSSYTTQILYSISDPPYIYVRNQYNWQEPWRWTNWFRLPTEAQSSYTSYFQINAESRSVEPSIKMNRYRPNKGNKYTRFYEADDDNAQLAIAQALPGSSSEGITRLNYNGNYTSLRGDVPLYLGENFAPIARFYFSDYGTSLPAAGNKGRVFFKKV